VVSQGLTVHHRVKESALPAAAMSKTMRQVLRPRGRVSRLVGFDATRNARTLLARMNLNDGDPRKVSAAPPKQPAPVLPTGPELADELMPGGLPRDWADWLRAHPWVLWLLSLFGLALVVALFFVAVNTGGRPVPYGRRIRGTYLIWLIDHTGLPRDEHRI